MSHPLPTLILEGSNPLAIGHQHGESLRQKIKEIAEIRMERMCALSLFKNTKDVLNLAAQHVNVLKQFDNDLFLELKGISEASSVSMEKLIVINHYTDMRDIHPSGKNDDIFCESSSGCTVLYLQSGDKTYLGQTWDVHGSALPYVVMLKLPHANVFSIAGCLGMCGMNNKGVAIAINNLNSLDAKVGIMWPALVRKVLEKNDALSGKEEILKAPLGSGHHYAILDKKEFISIETSGCKKKLLECENDYFVHTNHCLDGEMFKTHKIGEESNTYERLGAMTERIKENRPHTKEDIFMSFKEVTIEKDNVLIHKVATCGTILMEPNTLEIIACAAGPSLDAITSGQGIFSL